jgi:hypothetical protein
MASTSFNLLRVGLPCLAVCAFAFLINPAVADQKKADACAASLPKGARTVFDAAAKDAITTADLRSLIESKTRALVMSGGLTRADARSSAEAAGECLKLIRAS